MDDIVISARGVSKCYKVFDNARAQIAHAMWPQSRSGMQEVWALRDIDLEVRRGESVGIIGRNGSGKSTLLEIITGILTPTSGEARVNGRVSALLELGSGFNPEYTGRDNAILNGLLLGATRQRILEGFETIAEFAEIGAAMDRPVKTYSSGMVARLAFAVQVALDPEILIVDEALSVGDFFFQQKCAAHLRAMQSRGVTLLFVSHDMGMVRNICSRAIYLRSGELAFAGDAEKAALLYFQEGGVGQSAPARDAPRARLGGAGLEPGMGFAWQAPPREGEPESSWIVAVDFRDAGEAPATAFQIGDTMRVVVIVAKLQERCVPALMIRNALGQVVNVSYFDARTAVHPPGRSPTAAFTFEIGLALEAGQYSVEAYIAEASSPNVGTVLDQTPALGPILVEWNYETERAPFYGMFGLPSRVSVEALDS